MLKTLRCDPADLDKDALFAKSAELVDVPA